MTKQRPREGYLHWRCAFSSSSLPLSRTEVQGTLYHPHLIQNFKGLGDFYIFFIFILEYISWLYASKLRKLLLEGQGPSVLSESKQDNMWRQDIEEMAWAPGQLEVGRQKQKDDAIPHMTHLPLFVLNQSECDYLEIDMSPGRWCGLKSHQTSVLSFLHDLGQVLRILDMLFLTLSIDSGTTYVKV